MCFDFIDQLKRIACCLSEHKQHNNNNSIAVRYKLNNFFLYKINLQYKEKVVAMNESSCKTVMYLRLELFL